MHRARNRAGFPVRIAGVVFFLIVETFYSFAAPLQKKPVFPPIDRGEASLIIALRHTSSGWKEAYGFDTLVYRFFGDPREGFSAAWVGELHPDGERTVLEYRFSTVEEVTQVFVREFEASGFGAEKLEWTFSTENNLVQASGPVSRTVGIDAQGRVSFASPQGRYIESYPYGPNLAQADRETVKKTQEGTLLAEGKFLPPWSIGEEPSSRLRYVERKSWDKMGIESTEANYWNESGKVFFRVEGVEPLAEGFLQGFPALSADPYWLRCLALVDAIAGEPAILRPVYMAVNTFQSVSSSGGVAVISRRAPVLGWGMESFQEWSMILPEAELRRAPYLRSPLMGQPMAAN